MIFEKLKELMGGKKEQDGAISIVSENQGSWHTINTSYGQSKDVEDAPATLERLEKKLDELKSDVIKRSHVYGTGDIKIESHNNADRHSLFVYVNNSDAKLAHDLGWNKALKLLAGVLENQDDDIFHLDELVKMMREIKKKIPILEGDA